MMKELAEQIAALLRPELEAALLENLQHEFRSLHERLEKIESSLQQQQQALGLSSPRAHTNPSPPVLSPRGGGGTALSPQPLATRSPPGASSFHPSPSSATSGGAQLVRAQLSSSVPLGATHLSSPSLGRTGAHGHGRDHTHTSHAESTGVSSFSLLHSGDQGSATVWTSTAFPARGMAGGSASDRAFRRSRSLSRGRSPSARRPGSHPRIPEEFRQLQSISVKELRKRESQQSDTRQVTLHFLYHRRKVAILPFSLDASLAEVKQQLNEELARTHGYRIERLQFTKRRLSDEDDVKINLFTTDDKSTLGQLQFSGTQIVHCHGINGAVKARAKTLTEQSFAKHFQPRPALPNDAWSELRLPLVTPAPEPLRKELSEGDWERMASLSGTTTRRKKKFNSYSSRSSSASPRPAPASSSSLFVPLARTSNLARGGSPQLTRRRSTLASTSPESSSPLAAMGASRETPPSTPPSDELLTLQQMVADGDDSFAEYQLSPPRPAPLPTKRVTSPLLPRRERAYSNPKALPSHSSPTRLKPT